jgi:hypothetical protein
MKPIITLSLIFFIGVALIIPFHSAQAVNIWEGAKCGNTTIGPEGGPVGACNLCDAMIVLRNIITFGFELIFTIGTGMIAWGAIRMMAAGGNEKTVSEARGIMTSAIIGIVIAVSAWTIINVILGLLSSNGVAAPWSTITCQ